MNCGPGKIHGPQVLREPLLACGQISCPFHRKQQPDVLTAEEIMCLLERRQQEEPCTVVADYWGCEGQEPIGPRGLEHLRKDFPVLTECSNWEELSNILGQNPPYKK